MVCLVNRKAVLGLRMFVSMIIWDIPYIHVYVTVLDYDQVSMIIWDIQ